MTGRAPGGVPASRSKPDDSSSAHPLSDPPPEGGGSNNGFGETAAEFERSLPRPVPGSPAYERTRAESAGPTPDVDRSAAAEASKLDRASEIVELARDAGAKVFTCEGEPYFSATIEEHVETYPLGARSAQARQYLLRLYRAAKGRLPGKEALSGALEAFAADARDGGDRPVFLRVGRLETGEIVIDLGGPDWRAAIIGPDGWKVGPHPVAFRRTRSMRPLPTPERGGNLDELLRPFVNAATDDDYRLFVAALVAALRPDGPYPPVELHGEQASAKTSMAMVFRALCDPSASPTRADPREPRDLAVAAASNWCLAFDNLSAIPPWLSDGLCRLSTGGGFATRALYTDDEEKVLDAKRPVIFTSIEEVATRGDLLDRSLPIELRPITKSERQTEDAFWARFRVVLPRLFGALLDLCSAAQRELPGVELAEHPRMADFAELGVAIERGASWPPGSFLRAYSQSRQDAAQTPLDRSPLTPHLMKLAGEQDGFEGTASVLLERLNSAATEEEQRSKSWPKDPTRPSGALKRLAPSLRERDIEVEFKLPEGKSRRKLITLGHDKCAGTAFSAFSGLNGLLPISGEANPEPPGAVALAVASPESKRTLGTLATAGVEGQRSHQSPLFEVAAPLVNAENAENATSPSLDGKEEERGGDFPGSFELAPADGPELIPSEARARGSDGELPSGHPDPDAPTTWPDGSAYRLPGGSG